MEKAVSGYILKVFLTFTFGNWRNSNNNQNFSMCNDGVKDILVALDDINVNLYVGNQLAVFSKDKAASCRYGSLKSIYQTSEYPQMEFVVLEFPLVTEVLVEIESRRKGGDAHFSLTLSGMCSVYCGDGPPSVSNSLRRLLSREQLRINESISFTIPQSDWVGLLEKSNYGLFILIESSLIGRDTDDYYRVAVESLKKARSHLLNGNYSESIGECRNVLDVIIKNKATASLSKCDVKNLQSMTLKERYELVLNSIRNVTHLGHHREGEISSYESASAVLIITSSVAGLAMHGHLPERKQKEQEPNRIE
jgi:hypothetical protein